MEAHDGVPVSVRAPQERIAASDGLITATPEYKNGIPGVAKNMVDWLSRPPEEIGRVFRDRPVAVIGATPGGFGTTLAAAWLPVLRALGVRQWPGAKLMIAGAGSLFDGNGELVDADTGARAAQFLAGFAAFASASR